MLLNAYLQVDRLSGEARARLVMALAEQLGHVALVGAAEYATVRSRVALPLAALSLEHPPEPLTLREVQKRHILRTLLAAGGNGTVAARRLGINRKTMYKRLMRYRREEGL